MIDTQLYNVDDVVPILPYSNLHHAGADMWRLVTLSTLLVVSMAAAVPVDESKAFWKETPMERAVQDFKSKCSHSDDQVSCLKYEALTLLDQIFRKKSYKVSVNKQQLMFAGITAFCTFSLGTN